MPHHPYLTQMAYVTNGHTSDDAKELFARLCEEFPPLNEIRLAAIALQAEREKFDAALTEDSQELFDAGRTLLTKMQPLTTSEPVFPG